jgi:MGT family glycosyltransferase
MISERVVKKSKRIVLTPASNILAHAGRCIILARELTRRGHQVILAGSPKYLNDPEVVRDKDIRFYQLPDLSVEEAMVMLRTMSKTIRRSSVEKHIDAELEMFNVLKPDLVIVDFRLSIYISARVAKVPLISLLEGRWIEQYSVRKWKAIRTLPQYPFIRLLLGEKTADRIMPFFQRLILKYKILSYQAAFKKYGLEKKKSMGDLLTGDYNLILDTQLWTPTEHLPGNFRQVGPIYWAPENTMPHWVKELDRKRPIIYLTLGSTGHEDLFQKLFKVFGETEYQILVSTGGQIDISDHEIPKDFYLERYLPGEEIMTLADVVIHHGGTGTAYQAIKTFTPCIVIATHFEQEFLGEATEELGVGIFLSMIEVLKNPSLILESTQKIFAHLETYKMNMMRLKKDLETYDPVRTAADTIEDFLQMAA